MPVEEYEWHLDGSDLARIFQDGSRSRDSKVSRRTDPLSAVDEREREASMIHELPYAVSVVVIRHDIADDVVGRKKNRDPGRKLFEYSNAPGRPPVSDSSWMIHGLRIQPGSSP